MGLVLVIDDKYAGMQVALEGALETHTLLFASNGRDGLAVIEKHPELGCVLLDLSMTPQFGTRKREEGLAVLREIKRRWPDLPVVMLTGQEESENAAQALAAGAFHYLTKEKLDLGRLQTQVTAALENRELRRRVAALESAIRERDRADAPDGIAGNAGPRFGRLLSASPVMQNVFRLIPRIAQRPISVLITGDSGTGKELVAREIHDRSDRAKGPFVAVNCASIPRDLMESQLFGHEKGIFTSALAHVGYFVQADGGTLFLDEIGDMPVDLQAKLLRALQDQRIRPLGAHEDRQVNVRVISATHRDLDQMMEAGTFRADLFYRLNEFRFRLPSLMERPEDIPLLAEHFFEKHRLKMKTPAQRVSKEALELLAQRNWPGNARELEQAIRGAAALAEGTEVTAGDLRQVLSASPARAGAALSLDQLWQDVLQHRTPKTLVKFQDQYGKPALAEMMRRALAAAGNIRGAADILGFLSDDADGKAYDNFRQWMSRLGVRKRPDKTET